MADFKTRVQRFCVVYLTPIAPRNIRHRHQCSDYPEIDLIHQCVSILLTLGQIFPKKDVRFPVREKMAEEGQTA